MPSFADQQAPQPSYGPDIPMELRGAVLKRVAEVGPNATDTWSILARREGWVTPDGAIEEIGLRWGPEAASQTRNQVLRASSQNVIASVRRDAEALAVLLYMPPALFLDAVHYALLAGPPGFRRFDVINEVNDLFARKRIHYCLGLDGEPLWKGDAGAYKQVLQPTLDALGDARLAGCKHEFDQALAGMLGGTEQSRSDGMGKAAMAVESAMKVVLDAHNQARTGRETARPLWELLRIQPGVPAESEWTVLAASKWGNKHRHGAGQAPKVVPVEEATACVESAAVAIVYLAALLP